MGASCRKQAFQQIDKDVNRLRVKEAKLKSPGSDVTVEVLPNAVVLFTLQHIGYGQPHHVVATREGDSRFSIQRNVDSSRDNIQEMELTRKVYKGKSTGKLRFSEDSLGGWRILPKDYICFTNRDWQWKSSHCWLRTEDLVASNKTNLLRIFGIKGRENQLIQELQGPSLRSDKISLRQVPIQFWSSKSRESFFKEPVLDNLKLLSARKPKRQNNMFEKELLDHQLQIAQVCQVENLAQCIDVAWKLIKLGRQDNSGIGESYVPDVKKLSVGSIGHMVFEMMLFNQAHTTSTISYQIQIDNFDLSSHDYKLTPASFLMLMGTMNRFQFITEKFLKSELEIKTDDGKFVWMS